MALSIIPGGISKFAALIILKWSPVYVLSRLEEMKNDHLTFAKNHKHSIMKELKLHQFLVHRHEDPKVRNMKDIS